MVLLFVGMTAMVFYRFAVEASKESLYTFFMYFT